MSDILKYKHFIDGAWTDGESGEKMDVINPATGEVVARAPKGTKGDADRALASARTAFESGVWSGKSLEERSMILLKAAGLTAINKEKLAYLETITSGATIQRTMNCDVNVILFSLMGSTGVAGMLPKVEHATMFSPAVIPMHSYYKREPIGVCLGITPWNFPMALAIMKIAPALTMGNCIVMKPASTTPISTLELAKIFSDAGVPPGVFNVVSGPGASMGEYMAGHPEVDKIGFTGSTEVGKRIGEIAARGIKRVTLELGGKSPLIILNDADMETAVNMGALAFCAHQGQICMSGTRLFVPRPMQNEFVSKLIAKVKSLKMGDTLDPTTKLGPIANETQMNTVLNYIEIGKQEGAELVSGGKRVTEGAFAKGFYVEPAIFINCTNKMKHVREEIFGPVQCVIPYDDVDEAIAMANDTMYGLASGVCSTNASRAQRVASKLRAGNVYINTYHIVRPDAPFGGYKESGIGRESCYHALQAYSEVKHVVQNHAAGVDFFGMLGDM